MFANGQNITSLSKQTLQRSSERRHRIALIDGPNMSNLGQRNKKVYGTISSLTDLQAFVKDAGKSLGVDVQTFSSNYEGAILEYIHETAETVDGYIINPAGLTVFGEATRHALQETEKPVAEVHFANAKASGTHVRGQSFGPVESRFTPTVTAIVMGFREYSYLGALVAMVWALDDKDFLGSVLE